MLARSAQSPFSTGAGDNLSLEYDSRAALKSRGHCFYGEIPYRREFVLVGRSGFLYPLDKPSAVNSISSYAALGRKPRSYLSSECSLSFRICFHFLSNQNRSQYVLLAKKASTFLNHMMPTSKWTGVSPTLSAGRPLFPLLPCSAYFSVIAVSIRPPARNRPS